MSGKTVKIFECKKEKFRNVLICRGPVISHDLGLFIWRVAVSIQVRFTITMSFALALSFIVQMFYAKRLNRPPNAFKLLYKIGDFSKDALFYG